MKFSLSLILICCLFFVFKISANKLDKVVDLSWEYGRNTLVWPNVVPFQYIRKIGHSEKGYWYAMNDFCVSEHGGTHLDAPYHFNENGWTVGQIPINRLIGKGALIDLSKNSPPLLEAKHLKDWEKRNGKFQNGTILLIKFNWSQYWTNSTLYFGKSENGSLNFPGLAASAARWIANTNKFYGVGVDTASVDPGNTKDYFVHKLLASNKLYNLENVKLTQALPEKGFHLFVMPMKLKSGSGAPVRIFAVPENFTLNNSLNNS